MGSGLYRLPNHCHADSLIPAVRFFRKEKSSLLRAGYFLRRMGIFAQNTLETFCVAVSAPHVGMNFFFTKKWVGGRSSLRGAAARQGAGASARPPPHPQKMGIQGDASPWRSSRQSLEVFPTQQHCPPHQRIRTVELFAQPSLFFGDPCENRTRDSAVRGRRLSRLTKGPSRWKSRP